MNFEKAFDILLSHEGGFVNHPKDPGGATRYGVTQRVAQKQGYQGDMRELSLSEAKRIARAAYWDEVKRISCRTPSGSICLTGHTTRGRSRPSSGCSGRPQWMMTGLLARKL